MNGLSKETKEELMNSIQYRECDIIYKKQMYHIESCGKMMSVGIYDKTNEIIEKWIEIDEGNAEKSYQKFLNEPLFLGKTILEIIDELIIYSMR